jgi:hypothetical protein
MSSIDGKKPADRGLTREYVFLSSDKELNTI